MKNKVKILLALMLVCFFLFSVVASASAYTAHVVAYGSYYVCNGASGYLYRYNTVYRRWDLYKIGTIRLNWYGEFEAVFSGLPSAKYWAKVRFIDGKVGSADNTIILNSFNPEDWLDVYYPYPYRPL